MNNLEVELSALYSKKLCLDEVLQEVNTITFNQHILNLKTTDKIYILIKNVKTREEYICSHYTLDNKVIINLDDLSHCFTDYEGSIFIILKRGSTYHMYTPTINKKSDIKINNQISNNYKWFLRIVENGEIRISSVIKK